MGGLLTDGAYYEEVAPSTKELLYAGHGDNNIPMTCLFLCFAFHVLYQDIHGIVHVLGVTNLRKPSHCDNRKRVKAPAHTSCPFIIIAPSSL